MCQTHLDPLQNLVHHFDPVVFLFHLGGLEFSGFGRRHDIHGNHHDHDKEASEDARTHDLPKEVKDPADLEGGAKQKKPNAF